MTKIQSSSLLLPGAESSSFFSREKGSLRILTMTSHLVMITPNSNDLRDYHRLSGIGKLISDGAVLACYPLHDGTKDTIVSVGFLISCLSHNDSTPSRAHRGSCSTTSGLRSGNVGNINPWIPSEITMGSRWACTLPGSVSSLAISSWHAV